MLSQTRAAIVIERRTHVCAGSLGCAICPGVRERSRGCERQSEQCGDHHLELHGVLRFYQSDAVTPPLDSKTCTLKDILRQSDIDATERIPLLLVARRCGALARLGIVLFQAAL